VTVEENALAGGFGSAVAELLADHGLQHCRLARLGLPDAFVEQGSGRRCWLAWARRRGPPAGVEALLAGGPPRAAGSSGMVKRLSQSKVATMVLACCCWA